MSKKNMDCQKIVNVDGHNYKLFSYCCFTKEYYMRYANGISK